MRQVEDIENILREHKSVLREKYGVERIGVFGSYARRDADRESDIDILVELSEPVGWEFVDLKDFLEEILGLDVDLITKKALKPAFRDQVLDEVRYA